MQPRLQRYKHFIDTQFIRSLLWNKDYSLEGLGAELRNKIESGQFRKIVFTGMGCSAIVSDVIKGFFADQQIPIYVEVINDYDVNLLIDKEVLKNKNTMTIISSYSGHSQEPIKFYHDVKNLTQNIIFLTSGGKLAEIAKHDGVSIIYWKLRNPDREYPLFHVPQYFSILLDLFAELKILKTNFQDELKRTAECLKEEFNEQKIKQAESIAEKFRDREIVFLANPKWYTALLKLIDMHFNEMAMAPAHRNLIHEFTHSEIAVLTDPKNKLGIVTLRDSKFDEYTDGKVDTLLELLSNEEIHQNQNIEYIEILMDQPDFFQKFFSTLLFMSYVSYFLGVYNNTPSRELISIAAGNPWYNQKTIEAEKSYGRP